MTLLETMCQGEFLKKDEDQGWDLYEALSEKIIQWESYPEKTNPTTSRTGMHSIVSSIAAEAKITQLMRRLELLEARDPSSVNQVNPTQVISSGCTYCHTLTHLYDNPYSKTYNPRWRNHPNFSWSQSGLEKPRQQLPYQYTAQTHQPNFHQSQPNFKPTY